MVEVFVFAEGQTEERFIKQLVAPALRPLQVFLKPFVLNTSKSAKGGAVSFDRLRFYARNTLNQHPHAILSTFLDLYGLDTGFPGFTETNVNPDVYQRVRLLQQALHEAIVREVGCRPERFIPHIQPYEYEGLLFSDVAALCSLEQRWESYAAQLATVRSKFASPEHVNGSYETKPSKRLEDILHPSYKKTRHGPLAAERITLQVIEQECSHFKQWIDTLRNLGTA